jgi:hypothetical protein
MLISDGLGGGVGSKYVLTTYVTRGPKVWAYLKVSEGVFSLGPIFDA